MARKAATNSVGRLEMKPTVSDIRMDSPDGKLTSRMVGSSVAKSWSCAITCALVRQIEQGRFTCVGISDQGNERMGTSAAWRGGGYRVRTHFPADV